MRHELETDLLFAGGGMAGVCAAIAAARAGVKVVLVQDRSVLGGNASSEVRMHIVGADCHGGKKGARESGLIEELRLEDAVRNPQRCYPLWDVILYEKVAAEGNITLLLDTDVVGVEMDADFTLSIADCRLPTNRQSAIGHVRVSRPAWADHRGAGGAESDGG